VAISLHIFYGDFIERFESILANLDFPFDIYVTTTEKEIYDRAIAVFTKLSDNPPEIRLTPNQGRNFGPMLVEFGQKFLEYEAILHLHSKKSLYRGSEQLGWSGYLFNNLASRSLARQHLGLLAKDDVGISFLRTPKDMPFFANHWLKNTAKGNWLNETLKLEVKVSGPITYPIGGMFWFKPEAVRELLAHPWEYGDFEEENGQLDGTLAHAIERYFSALSTRNGFKTIAWETIAPFASEDKSFALEEYFEQLDGVTDTLLEDIPFLSLDFFDTIAFRTHPYDDYAKYLTAQSFGLDDSQAIDFVNLRNLCEFNIRIDKTDGDVGLQEVSVNFSCALERELGLSIEPTELHAREVSFEGSILRPKSRICKIISKRQSLGKQTVIVSDTYYQMNDFLNLLDSVGISREGLDIRLSSETGLRKDRGDYWKTESLRFQYDQDFLHIGDNYVSDAQVPGDFGLRAMLILNSRDLAKLHGIDIDNSLESMRNFEHVYAHRIFQNQERIYLSKDFAGGRQIHV
jgi:FMN phosphatase YigB (HAD superfamily)